MTAPESAEPEDLVERIRRGDQTAEAELANCWGRGIRVMIQRSLTDTNAVEDLCQETLLLAIRKVRNGELRESSRLPGFIAALARNLVIEHGRRKRPAPLTNAADPAVEASQLDDLIREQRALRVRQVLQSLPSQRDREILFCFYLTGEDKESICRRLGLSSLHFNRVLHRARERYRELYREAG